MKKLVLTLIVLLVFQPAFAKESTRNINAWKKGVVSISNKIVRAPYGNTGDFNGTGFLADKQRGLIVTNKHITSNVNVNDTIVTFFNGREMRAKLLYSDPQHDFSFLQVDATQLPPDVIELKLAKRFPVVNESVTIIGSNDNQSFSVQSGIVTSVYETSNYFPSQTVRISLNAKGGSSGSPIISSNSEVVALNYAVDITYAYALPAAYVLDALDSLVASRIPPRKDLGALYSYYSLDKAERFFRFPKSEIKQYLKNFPNSQNKGIIVQHVVHDSPADGILQPGDIIWDIEGKPVGPNLYLLHKWINDADKELNLGIYRMGQKQNIKIVPRDLHKLEISKMLLFDDAVFFEVDPFINLQTGAKLGSVFVVNFTKESAFSSIPTMIIDGAPMLLVGVTKIDGNEINSLDDFINVIPELKSRKHFTLFYKNFIGKGWYNSALYLNRSVEYKEMDYDEYDNNIILLTKDGPLSEWKSKYL